MKNLKKRNPGQNIKLVWPDEDALSLAAAHYVVKACAAAIAAKGYCTIALSGGNTPKKLYSLLAAPAFSRNMDWKKVYLLWGDERFVPHTHEDSNYRMVKEHLLDHISIPKKNVLAVPTKGKPEDCAEKYEAALKKIPGKKPVIDIMLLGMGDDGHTASLFPGTPILKEKKSLVKAVWVEAKQTFRISFTYPLINKSRHVFFLVAGAAKAPVLKQIFSGKKIKQPYPVQGIAPGKGDVCWLVDEAAVS